jgi:transcriptional regulator with XRE-family HTH domain
MPAQAPAVTDPLARRDLETLGELLRTQRKSMRIAAESVARAANMSRQTLHRIERGEPSVTMGAYLSALRALGLELKVVGAAQPAPAHEHADAVRLADYPQLEHLAWHRQGETLTEKEAFALYERNWRHIDRSSLGPAERDFIARLVKRYGKGALLV